MTRTKPVSLKSCHKALRQKSDLINCDLFAKIIHDPIFFVVEK